jgi:phosphate transport system protein
MTHLEAELEQLKNTMEEMMALVEHQITHAKQAFLELNNELAEEIIHTETRVNSTELHIDRDCENIFALYNPVAIDLRFVLAIINMNSDLERIADHAYGIARYVKKIKHKFDPELLVSLRFEEMFDLAISMVQDISESFSMEDSQSARKVFLKDEIMNEIQEEAIKAITKFIKSDPETIKNSLFLFSTIQKLERVGDLTKNIAEQIIFHIEAKVLRHKSKKKKMKGA